MPRRKERRGSASVPRKHCVTWKVSPRKLGQLYRENVEIVRQEETAAQVEPETTTIDTDPEGHTPAEMETISAYQNSVDKGIKGFVARVRTLQNKKYRNKVRYTISEVSDAAATTVKNLTGVDPTGFTNILTGGAVDHIDHRHGKNGQADSSMADDNDLARVQFVLDHFDGAKLLTDENGEPSLSNVWKNSDGTQARRVMFYKKSTAHIMSSKRRRTATPMF